MPDVPIRIDPYEAHKDIKFDGVKTTPGRVSFAISCWTVSLIAFIVIAKIIIGEPETGLMVGTLAWAAGFFLTLKLFFVAVPAVTAVITTNEMTGALHVYETGFFKNVKFPFERYKVPTREHPDGDFISTRLVEFSLVESYQAQDGPMIQARVAGQYKPDLWNLYRYIGVNKEDIQKNLAGVVSHYLGKTIMGLSAKEALEFRDTLRQGILDAFELDGNGPDRKVRRGTLETLYGINMIFVNLEDLDYEIEYQKTVSTVQSIDVMHAKAKEIASKSDGSVNEKDALNLIMVRGGHAKKTIVEAEGQGVQGFASTIMAILGRGDGNTEQAQKPKDNINRKKGDKK